MLKFIFICVPYGILALLGLCLGAVLPPHLYRQRKYVALALNVVGFLLYAWPALIVNIVLFSPGFVVSISTAEAALAIALMLGIFLVTELLTFRSLRVSRRR